MDSYTMIAHLEMKIFIISTFVLKMQKNLKNLQLFEVSKNLIFLKFSQ